MSIEQLWLPIVGYENKYEISTWGAVRNVHTQHVLAPMMTGTKRRSSQRAKVRFSTDPRLDYDVAALVLTHFLGPRPSGYCVMHLDDDPRNNNLTNLRWGSRKENSQDMAKKKRGWNQRIGGQEALDIFKLRMCGVTGKEVAKRYGISMQRVCDIFKGRTALIVLSEAE